MRTRTVWPAAVGGLSFAYLLAYPLAIGRADESHLLHPAKRVLDGDVLYRDVFETLTPLAYYLFAAVYRIAGPTLLAARVCIALVEAAGCALLFYLVRRVAGGLEAVLAVLIFAGICIPTWPYASPHWISTTLGLLVATIMLADRWQGSSRLRPFVAGILGGVAICVQQQRGVFLAAWLPLVLGVLACALPRDVRWRTLGREIAWAAGGGAIVTFAVLGHAVWTSSLTAVMYAVYGFAVTRYGPMHGGNWWAAVFPFTEQWLHATWLWLLWISPLFLVGDGLLLLRRGGRPWDRRDLERACLWLLAALMAASIWYLPDFIHVSFVLPFLLIPGAGLLHAFRTATVWARVPAGRQVVELAVWGFILAVAGQAAANVSYAHAIAPARFETAFGVIEGEPAMERLFHAVRRHLVREPEGGAVVFSYPTDAWLYLALPADDPTRFSAIAAGFFPPEHVQEVVDALQARRPGTVVVRRGFTAGPVLPAIEAGYDPVEDVDAYRIYMRREQRAPP